MASWTKIHEGIKAVLLSRLQREGLHCTTSGRHRHPECCKKTPQEAFCEVGKKAPPAGLEPATQGLGNPRSVH